MSRVVLQKAGVADMMDEADLRIIRATQAGLPLVPRPYHAVADQLGLTPHEVMTRMQRMLDGDLIRRIGAVPNHYRLGYHGNGMSVWDVPDPKVQELGARVGNLDFVSHCYQRPRHLPDWPYNLFAMVHGHDRNEVHAKVAQIHALLGTDARRHAVLFSTAILKKTGLRLRPE